MLTRDYYEHEWSIFWSGGKDSTATVLKAIEFRIPIKEVIYVRLMYDNNISAVIPMIDDFVLKTAEKFKSMGINVHIIEPKETAKELSERIYKRSKYPQRNGTRYTLFHFIRGMCKMQPNKEVKIENKYQLIGIGADEIKRYARLDNKYKKSLLFDLGITQTRAKEICKENNMLNPIYTDLQFNRDGCWFYPNTSKKEIEYIKNNHNDLYEILKSEYEIYKKVPVLNSFNDVRNAWVKHFYNCELSGEKS